MYSLWNARVRTYVILSGDKMPNTQVRVLVVDDYAALRASLSEVFTGLGHSVRSAEDGFSALAAFRQEVPDVLLSDLDMPGMSGFELLSVVRRRFPAVLVIAMSGAFSGASVPEGVAADVFYEKGTGLGSLLKIMEESTRLERLSLIQHPQTLAPVWIKSNGHDPAGEPYITISCPECMRAFPQIIGTETRLIRETECVFCHNSIAYSVVRWVEETAVPTPVR